LKYVPIWSHELSLITKCLGHPGVGLALSIVAGYPKA
jgi:hypothetical protein